MFQPEKLGRHNHAFMVFAGILSALVNAGVLFMVADRYALEGDLSRMVAPLVLAATSFVAFYTFHLMISARSMFWMLRQGAVRWLRILLAAMVLFFFVLHEQADVDVLRAMLLEWSGIALLLQCGVLAILRISVFHVNTSASNRRKAVFIGLGPDALKLAHRLIRSPILGMEIAGYYADELVDQGAYHESVELRYLGKYLDAIRRVDQNDFSVVFVAMRESDSTEMSQLMDHLYDSTSSIYFMPEPRLSEGFSVQGAEIAGVSLLALHETPMVGASRYIKRFTDLVLSALALVLLSPIMLVVAAAVKLDSPGPVLYRQKRYGEGARPITIYKFRSMRVDASQDGVLRQASRDDDRVTRVGRFLRRSSIDELPQLFNVLGGSMSLVGPRPHAASHNEFYRHKIRGYMLRHTVKPGITGWAQVNGLRGETDTLEKMEQRVQYDRFYITHWSFWLDIKILFKTFLMVFYWGRNAY
ncbi:undecaprenyl-phosphate glucose phosphotransferase [Neopusillimonas aromaticivorans]|uniref:undecaprenyl-phosphate glucose phosphotransferase n=1 Tax=Neopusillimonas aromaticivorans TaxID=2979868 RepID=UPI0025919263|nr:undecaprenyl-phosphate glucose phosphotransferase [Neopusillimonas aromaticivorans]WJJ94318.1 undecaprenyl-phosphate glucose phosphotransferase [Neopusillimonas aromaticivorans]